eukprot:gb/GFBE01015540.1/.p1 GENE.gb/GFBE01015540.1/~~gb/GFBE01015540.1/.p1  ORF type:complete len:371 (+),score=48.19 gb/GFBE01015540.1/:1-1113(+)
MSAADPARSSEKDYGSCKDASTGSLPEEDPESPGSGNAPVGSRSFWFRREWDFAWNASVELMLECLDSVTGHAPEDAQSTPWLRYNPLWWCAVLACQLCVLPGHAFHSLLGQGDKVRPDEMEVERKARVGWVYSYSGGFVVTIIMDLVPLFWPAAEEQSRSEAHALVRGELVAVAISAWYLMGDANLLYQMSRRDTVLMHASVSARISFGVALLFVFAALWVRPDRKIHGFTLDSWTDVSWLLRFGFCLFMVVAYYGYSPLLGVCYEKVNEDDVTISPWAKPYSKRLRAVTVLGPVLLLGLSVIAMETGSHPLYLMMIPVCVAVLAFSMEGMHITLKTFLASCIALSPIIIVAAGFVLAGPKLWTSLAGK